MSLLCEAFLFSPKRLSKSMGVFADANIAGLEEADRPGKLRLGKAETASPAAVKVCESRE